MDFLALVCWVISVQIGSVRRKKQRGGKEVGGVFGIKLKSDPISNGGYGMDFNPTILAFSLPHRIEVKVHLDFNGSTY